jgi:hypothetical protein
MSGVGEAADLVASARGDAVLTEAIRRSRAALETASIAGREGLDGGDPAVTAALETASIAAHLGRRDP